MRIMHWKNFGWLALIAAIAGGYFFFFRGNPAATFKTVPVSLGDLDVSIGATGTLQPEEVVDVGAQIAGQISSFGQDKNGDSIDYRSEVEEGMLLAKIDDVTYLSELSQSQAQQKRADANLLQAKARLSQAERDWNRAQKLGPSDALSQSSYDSYRAAFEIAQANMAVADAEIAQAAALVARAERNLSYCTINSPVNGVVIDRRVNIGQTVVASLNAPSLFLIAKDLKKMQVWVSVNEADVGKIFPGQKVSFTVDAFPNEEFSGVVRKVRLNASMTQNVVSYIVEVSTDNPSGRLMPYLTANVRFSVADKKGVLLIPNSALRFRPENENGAGTAQAAVPGQKNLWTVENGSLKPLNVKVGETDGIKTEISGEGLAEGLQIVIARQAAPDESAQGGTVNPLAPSVRQGGTRRGG